MLLAYLVQLLILTGKELNCTLEVCNLNIVFNCSIHTIFGHVVSGEDMIEKINSLPCDNIFRPLQDVKVVKSGELILRPKKKKEKKKKRSSSSESIDSEKKSSKRKEKHRER